ncbi:MAG: Tyrosine recombinase XerC [Desulfovibrio sp.]
MSDTWIKVERGIRYREHATRKYGVPRHPDRYYVLRFAVGGIMHQEALGWESEGITLEKARIELAKLKEAKRTGEGPCSLTEKRELAEKQRKAEEEARRAQEATRITVADFWRASYKPAQGHKAHGSLVAEDALWRKWLKPRIGSIALVDLTPALLDKIKSDMMAAAKAPSSIKYAMAVVSQMWTLAERDGIASGRCPTKKITLPRQDNRRERYLTVEEADKLLAALAERTPLMHDMAILGLDCGLRFGEIAGLIWQDCDFDREMLQIRDPKSGINRVAYMTPRVRQVLEDRNGNGHAYIFIDHNGNPVQSTSRAFKNVVNELFNQGVTDKRHKVCFHTLRHTFASRLVEGSTDLYSVSRLMGHSTIRMTERYSHLSPDKLKNAISILHSVTEKKEE